MTLADVLRERRTAIVDSWFRCIVETYPPETSSFLTKQKDRFANPAGSMFAGAVESLFNELLGGNDRDRMATLIDDIVRVRAVQDFAPSMAVGIFFRLKGVIREELADKAADPKIARELVRLESNIDSLALQAFDAYMKCRERIWEIKHNDVMKRPFVLTEGGMCPSYLLRKAARREKEGGTNNSHN